MDSVMTEKFLDLGYRIQVMGISLVIILFLLGLLAGIGYVAFLLWKYRNREEHSLDTVLLQVAVPRDNEIKIDAAEQMFSSLHSIAHGGFWSF